MSAMPLNRRTMLRGLGAAVALPWLEALAPSRAVAAAARPPVRLAFLFVPNGVRVSDWTPATTGSDFLLPPTLEPLAPVREKLLVLSGLTHDKGRANGDGPGDHARGASTFLTGAQPCKTAGADIRVGVSVDQFAAQRIGKATRLPSLELGIDRGGNAGDCDSGYSCAYSNNISWRSPSTPAAKEIDPQAVFERLFGGGSTEADAGLRRRQARQSVLDFVLDDARRLHARLGAADRRKMDEYCSSLREVELRIDRAAADHPNPAGMPRPTGIPREFRDHLRLMCDLLVLAFQTDATRIATFMFARDGSNRSYSFAAVPDGHHDLSHHQGNPEKLAKLGKIDRFHVEQLAYLLQRLEAIREGEGTLLDHCAILYGSGLGDGNRHNHDNLPVLLAGRAGGTIRAGRHVRFDGETPMANLFLELLDRVGVGVDRFGDSTGRLASL
jgi:hypothetical protein